VDRCRLAEANVSGSDISATAIAAARRRLPAAWIAVVDYPVLDAPLDLVICSEVLEHTTAYRRILEWTHGHLAPGGAAVFTTQAGPIHASDRYAGHAQHFALAALSDEMRHVGLAIERSYRWGFPLFSLQKWLTNWRFERIRRRYLEGGLTPRKRLTFAAAHLAYFLHDFIPFGPQLVVTVRRPARGTHG
jgi:SAM-dependent methyltransferase